MAFFPTAQSVYCRLSWWHSVQDWHLGGINLLEGYGNDNPGAKSQGMKQLMAGGGCRAHRHHAGAPACRSFRLRKEC